LLYNKPLIVFGRDRLAHEKRRAPERTGWDGWETPPGLSRASCGVCTPTRKVTEQTGVGWSISIRRFAFVAVVTEKRG
jgi:hypothetical protein